MNPRPSGETPSRSPGWLRALIALAALLMAVLVIAASLAKRLDHDEHQFVAAAYLFAKDGLLPYVDYPYFHVPNLVAAYAILFQTTNYLLLSARLFSASCSLITLSLIAVYAVRLFRQAEVTARQAIALGSIAALVGTPLFIYTSGLAWNHDASVMLSVAAVLALLWAVHGRRRPHGIFLSGVLLGLGIGTRLTVLPLLLPMLAGCVLLGRKGRRREWLYRLGWFCFGLVLALIPTLLLLAAAPEDFLFGNYGYALLNTAYRESTGYTRAMSPLGKIALFTERAADPGNLSIFVFLGFVLYRLGRDGLREEEGREVIFLVILVAFAFLGSLAPTPAFTQYFFAVIPFVLVAGLRGMAILDVTARSRAVRRLFTVVVAVSVLRGLPSYVKILTPLASRSAAVRTHMLGLKIRDRVDSGKVLTLAPIYPLEGGVEIYRQFVTGPFAWRTAPLLPPSDRERYSMISPNELWELLNDEPPVAILIGAEPDHLEQPLVNYAVTHGFQAVTFSQDLTLWIPPREGPQP